MTALRWLGGRPVLVAFVLIVAGNFMAWRAITGIVADNEAQRCIDDWETVMEVRRAIPIPGEAIVEVATDADPERIAEFRAAVDRRIEEAFPNPDCDLGSARAQLDD